MTGIKISGVELTGGMRVFTTSVGFELGVRVVGGVVGVGEGLLSSQSSGRYPAAINSPPEYKVTIPG